MREQLKWHDEKADNSPWINALAELRQRASARSFSALAFMSSMDLYLGGCKPGERNQSPMCAPVLRLPGLPFHSISLIAGGSIPAFSCRAGAGAARRRHR
jgi:hypothetical protein